MVERKNRDPKPRLAILVGDDHTTWAEKLPAIRFAMNTSWCETTGQTAAYLTFDRELRTLDDITHDLTSIVENFVPQITPYLEKMSHAHKRDTAPFAVGNRVWVTHTLHSADKGITTKFHPKRDGPYEILQVVSPVSFQVCNPTESNIPLGIYHMSALSPVEGQVNEKPVVEIKRRGRPPKKKTLPSNNNGPSSGRVQDHGGVSNRLKISDAATGVWTFLEISRYPSTRIDEHRRAGSFIPPRGDLSMLFNEPEIQYKYKNIVDNTQDEPGDSICCKQKKRFWILLRMILQRVLEKLHVSPSLLLFINNVSYMRNFSGDQVVDTGLRINSRNLTAQSTEPIHDLCICILGTSHN
ncbi:hypothetical protein NQ317_000645 [Molorchus minor]|uniref:Uncharacterized protein n=1 Tax=Molorchus minor TaxID=1323400 RepID=A0ABQ9J125_9CUCU|nr:hypothetical protein NQ317_000645 [Molorchus minor]